MIRWGANVLAGVKYGRILPALLAVALTPAAAALAQESGPTTSPPPATEAPPPPLPDLLTRWTFAGDFRVRYEDTTKQKPGAVPGQLDPRHRMVIRFRSGVTKKLTDQFDFGVRVATGARGDPNTTDITLGDFVDKFEISLDRVYLGWGYHKASLVAGRFVNPFVRTELVWDDDVNLQGVGGTYTLSESKRVIPKFSAVYSIVDEQSANPDSYMLGGQMQVKIQPSKVWNLTLAGGYYDYTIRSLTHADAGDTLSNHLNDTKTAYLSDFNLVDATAIAESSALGARWPIRITGDWVKNFGTRGAAKGEDEGFKLEAIIGRTSAKKDTRFRYGIARVETDAVLAAFSHDNLSFATNYVEHTIGADYVASPNVTFNVTWYLFRRDQLTVGPGTGPGFDKHYVSRLRLNVIASW